MSISNLYLYKEHSKFLDGRLLQTFSKVAPNMGYVSILEHHRDDIPSLDNVNLFYTLLV